VGDDATSAAAHDTYVAGRFGYYYYDGVSAAGLPKPIVHATRFLREYLDAVGSGADEPPRSHQQRQQQQQQQKQQQQNDGWANASRYSLSVSAVEVPRRSDGSSSMGGAVYSFSGPDCLILGGQLGRYVVVIAVVVIVVVMVVVVVVVAVAVVVDVACTRKYRMARRDASQCKCMEARHATCAE
jgi:hypothetical protein